MDRDRHDRWQFQLHSRFDPAEAIHFDAHLYYGSASSYDIYRLPESFRVDLGATWRLSEFMEVSLTGRNFFDLGRLELEQAGYEAFQPEIPRELFVNLKVRF